MKYILLILFIFSLHGCVATTGDLESAVADITGRIDVVARDAQQSADAARDAWERGEITYAEMQSRLQDIRAATLDSAKDITREVVDGVKETIRARPEEAIETGTRVVGGLLPGPWGDIVAGLGGAAAAALYASRRAKEEAERVNRERDAARVARGEHTGSQAVAR